MVKKKILIMLNLYRLIPAFVITLLSGAKSILSKDLARWMDLEKMKGSPQFCYAILLIRRKEFRNLVEYRIRSRSRMFPLAFRVLFPLMDTLYLNTPEIGEGLYIQHGFSSIISAKSIGKNCYINQQVTIGYNGTQNPVVGDNVHICAGAIVIGGCTVGENSIVGAGAVVTKNVPPNEIWGGYRLTL